MTKAATQTMTQDAAGSYHHGDLRSALIAASVDLVCDVGADAFTLKDASRIAGVSVAAPYRHFADKAELLFEVAEQGFQRMHKRMLQILEGHEIGSIGAITVLGQGYVGFAGTYPHLFRLMFTDHQASPDVSLETLMAADVPGPMAQRIVQLLDVGSTDMTSYELAKSPNKGIACFSILLKNLATFLDENGIDVGETLRVATPLWALVHGTASLLIDKNFQNFMPGIETDDIIARSTRYYLNGLLQEEAGAS